MRLHRFFGNFDLRKERFAVSDRELINQWRNVLRFEIGSELVLCDGKLNEALARIISFDKNSAEIEILGISKNESEPKRSVALYVSILKGEHAEIVAEKATEIGVSEIVPIISERTVKQSVRPERLLKVIREAAEQSGRGVIPTLHEPLPLMLALRQASVYDTNFFLHYSGDDISNFAGKNFHTAGVFVGPEGGWTGAEIALAKKSDFKIVTLGNLTLRAETAAIVGVYSVLRMM
ncbi:MAG: RsmE family RNA methyltransferase [Patescibacteria group bacterium]